jgi:hypothetical protein
MLNSVMKDTAINLIIQHQLNEAEGGTIDQARSRVQIYLEHLR